MALYRLALRVLLPRRAVVIFVELDARTVGFFLPVVLILSLSVTVVLRRCLAEPVVTGRPETERR